MPSEAPFRILINPQTGLERCSDFFNLLKHLQQRYVLLAGKLQRKQQKLIGGNRRHEQILMEAIRFP